MIRLLISSYLVFILPYIISGKTTEFVVNAKYLANDADMTSLTSTATLYLVLFLSLQLLVSYLCNKYLVKK